MPRQTKFAMEALEAEGGAGYFERIHHFASPKFRSDPSTFQEHWDYCGGVQSFRDDGNNDQTCRRIQAVVQHRKRGATWDRAIQRAWEQFPALSKP